MGWRDGAEGRGMSVVTDHEHEEGCLMGEAGWVMG